MRSAYAERKGPWGYRRTPGDLVENSTVTSALLARLRDASNDFALSWYHAGSAQLRLRFCDLAGAISTFSAKLLASGVEKGDRVIVLSANGPEAYIAHLAIMSIGAVTVPINNEESERTLEFIVGLVRPTIVVVGRNVASELLQNPKLPLRLFVSLEEPWEISAGFLERAAAMVSADDPAVILFTSGTTSNPKGVTLSHYNLLVNAEGLRRKHNLDKKRVHFCMLPLFHANAFGFSMIASLYAATHVVLCDGLPGFDIWEILRREKVNIVSAVPVILGLLSKRTVDRSKLPDLSYFVSAAAPLSKVLAQEFIGATGVRVHQGYGLSECVNFAATIDWDIDNVSYHSLMQRWKVPSIGSALFGCKIAIRRPDGSEAQQEEEGEVTVTGHNVMQGYWQDDSATQAALGAGYLKTGDVGFAVTVEGIPQFFITGRLKEVIIRAGGNLSPIAVEAELETLRSIGPIAVAGFPNEHTGEEVGLYILGVLTPATRAQALEAVQRCARAYKPSVVLFGNEPIPATSTGKTKRASLALRFKPFAQHKLGHLPLITDAQSEQ